MTKTCGVVCYRSIKNPDALAACGERAGPGYQEAPRVLGDTVERDLRNVEGVS